MSLPTVLENIVAKRRTHLPEIRQRIAHVNVAELAPSTRSLYDNLHQGGRGSAHFIMECKAASPSLGEIRADYRPDAIARIYSKYAAGISVLCEPERFRGDYDHLAAVRANTHLPVLCKDFIIAPEQVYAARYFGADAILLMMSVLDDATYRELADLADSLGLDVLTEVIDTNEIDRALALGAQILGINNRNLHDLSIDLSRTITLSKYIPEDVVLLSESGIRNHQTVTELAGYCNGFLVGSQLTGTPDIDAAARALLYGENKVCGLHNAAEARLALTNGAVYGGLIRVKESPRYVSRETSSEIMETVPGLNYVIVTRDSNDFASSWVPGASAIQLHAPYQGSAAAELELITRAREELAALAPEQPLQVWRAVSMTNPEHAGVIADIAAAVDRLVLDSGAGGTGKAFDWEHIPAEYRDRILLAGGIGVDNIAAALEQNCSGLDLNSGVEYPASAGKWAGMKDAGKIAACFANIRAYNHGTQ